MDYQSILYPDDGAHEPGEITSALHDAGIDRIIEAICANPRWQETRQLFQVPPQGIACARWRQSVFQDLMEHPELAERIQDFSGSFCSLLDDLSATLQRFLPNQVASLDDVARMQLLRCADRWCHEVDSFAADLAAYHLHAALASFQAYLSRYVASEGYARLKDDVDYTEKLLGYVQYALLVDENGMRVRKYQGEPALSQSLGALEAPFASFMVEGSPKPAVMDPLDEGMEGAVLAAASHDFGDQFRALARFCERHSGFADERLARFAWDVRFYLAWLSFTQRLVPSGCSFSLPELTEAPCVLACEDAFDATLALDGVEEVVPNSVSLVGDERIVVLSGAEGAGRSSLARALAQISWLASLGLTVPARSCRISYADGLVAWSQKARDAKVQLAGVHGALAGAGGKMLLVLDCPLPDGAPQDQAAFMELLASDLGALPHATIVVAGPDGLAVTQRLERLCASYAFGQDVENPGLRNHRLERSAPLGMEFAREMADRHGLSYSELAKALADARMGADEK